MRAFYQLLFRNSRSLFQKNNFRRQFSEINLFEKWTHILERNNIPDVKICINEIKKFAEKSSKDKVISAKIFEESCSRRLKSEPLQYIIEEWDFRNLTLKMQSPVFIPRPETEGLVDLVLNDIEKLLIQLNRKCLNVLEIGCGSGAISLSLLNECSKVEVVCIDVLKDAVNLTKENASRCGITKGLTVINKDIVEVESIEDLYCKQPFDMIVSNPPYIESQIIPQLQNEVKNFESILALDGGDDGLQLVKIILDKLLHLGSSQSSLWLELDEHHGPLLENIVNTNYESLLSYEATYDDCFGRSRFSHVARRVSSSPSVT